MSGNNNLLRLLRGARRDCATRDIRVQRMSLSALSGERGYPRLIELFNDRQYDIALPDLMVINDAKIASIVFKHNVRECDRESCTNEVWASLCAYREAMYAADRQHKFAVREFDAAVTRITHWRATEYVRAYGKESKIQVLDNTHGQTDISDKRELMEQLQELERLVQTLSEKDQQIIWLRIRGDQYRDIAAFLGLTVDCVAKRWQRSLEELRRSWERNNGN
jgi:hypothetical protein